MRKDAIEGELYILKRDRETIIGGNGKFDLVAKYALGEGTGLHAFSKAKEAIDSRIDMLEKELDKIPVVSALENARRTYEYCGATNATTEDYIKALEACRPWVIKNKHNGGLLCSSESPYGIMMFPTKDKAVPYCDHSRCEVVQWEGNQ